jgi:hypothetical protein
MCVEEFWLKQTWHLRRTLAKPQRKPDTSAHLSRACTRWQCVDEVPVVTARITVEGKFSAVNQRLVVHSCEDQRHQGFRDRLAHTV